MVHDIADQMISVFIGHHLAVQNAGLLLEGRGEARWQREAEDFQLLLSQHLLRILEDK